MNRRMKKQEKCIFKAFKNVISSLIEFKEAYGLNKVCIVDLINTIIHEDIFIDNYRSGYEIKIIDAIYLSSGAVDIVLKKNKSYGGSVFKMNSFVSNHKLHEKGEGILLRIDDKLNRILHGEIYDNDNDLLDLFGYVILYHAFNMYRRNK